MAPSKPGSLVLIGGGARPAQALQYFAREGEGPVLIISWASRNGAESYSETRPCFDAVGVSTLASPKPPRSGKARADFLQALALSRGVFFGGGDQNRIMDFLEGAPELEHALIAAFRGGKTFGGTSAGTAIASPWMISGETLNKQTGGRKILMRRGLGLLSSAVVDQHFLARGRHYRLFQALEAKPHQLGIGVDENAAVIVRANHSLEAVAGQVVVLRALGIGGTLRCEILQPGEKYDLRRQRKAPPPLRRALARERPKRNPREQVENVAVTEHV